MQGAAASDGLAAETMSFNASSPTVELSPPASHAMLYLGLPPAVAPPGGSFTMRAGNHSDPHCALTRSPCGAASRGARRGAG